MNDHGQGILWYAPLVVLVILSFLGLLLLLGPSIGGAPRNLNQAVHDMLTGDDRVLLDEASPPPVASAPLVTAVSLPWRARAIPTIVALPPPPTATVTAPCAAFHFRGALRLEDGQASFGRFNTVTDTDPYGKDDPLASWKLIQFQSFPLRMEGMVVGAATRPGSPAGRVVSATIPVDQAIDLLINDPFTQDVLFSARWQVDEIEIRGSRASINADLEANLSDIRVRNTIRSGTLAGLARAEAGVLVVGLEHTSDILVALQREEPVYAALSGTVHEERCIR